jgi:hypothetical protein
VKGILADVNIQGQVDLLVTLMQAAPWKLFWDDLRLQYFHFSGVGLPHDSPDSKVWDVCQEKELVLITDNRNEDDLHSLESTIRSRNTPVSLPIVTIANIPRLARSQDYAERVIDRLLDFLMRIDSLRGAGRLYVP